jgi:hypothetical protein
VSAFRRTVQSPARGPDTTDDGKMVKRRSVF